MEHEDELNKEELYDSEFSEVRNMLLRLRKVKASDNFHSRLKQKIATELSDSNFLEESATFISEKQVGRALINKKFRLLQLGFFQRPVFVASVIIGIILLIMFSIYNLTQLPQKDIVTTPLSKETQIQPLVNDTLFTDFKDNPQFKEQKEQVDKFKENFDKLLIAENTKPRKHTDNKLKGNFTNDKSLIKEEVPKPSQPIEEKKPDANSKSTTTQSEISSTPKEPTAVDTKKESTQKPDVLAMPKSDLNTTRGQKTKKMPKQKVKDEDITKEQLEKIKEEVFDKIKKEF
ncbi:MAG: hypothetical protein ACP5P3_02660 [Ignavibacteria bacterium]